MSRRVKKGPGRRLQFLARRRFMRLIERGWSIRGAAIEVGVSGTSGNNGARGYKVCLNGQVVGFVSPLDRLAVREVSSRYLSQDERIEIADLKQAGVSVRQIAQRIGRSLATVSRELRRDCMLGGRYQPFSAHRDAVLKRDHRTNGE